jgi:hypothetical protein
MRKIILAPLLLAACAYALFIIKGRLIPQKHLGIKLPTTLESILQPAEQPVKPPFDFGEKFEYIYTMGPLRAGSAKLSFVEKTSIFQKDAYLIKFESRVGTFYDLEDIYAEIENFYPIYVERNIQNLGVQTDIKEIYDQKNYKVEITKTGPLKEIFGKKTKVIKKQNPIHNALLLIYHCRNLPSSQLKVGYEFDIVLPVDEFKVTLKRIENIKVPAGNFQAYFFESAPKRIKLWIATDEKRTPLKMENLTSFGPSSIILEK